MLQKLHLLITENSIKNKSLLFKDIIQKYKGFEEIKLFHTFGI